MKYEPAPWVHTTWGQIAQLEYGKALRDRTNDGPITIYGTNGPTGRTDRRLGDGPTVVIGRKGAYRGVHYASGPFWVIDTAFYLVPNDGVDITWAYYELCTHDIDGLDSGSAIPSTRRDDFYAMRVQLPPLSEQYRIARVLKALDDKIDCNRRLAALLDETNVTVFRARFVNFAGVEEFQESDIGRIPLGWSTKNIDELATVNARSVKVHEHPDHIKYIDISSVGTRCIHNIRAMNFAEAPSRARRLVNSGDTIISTVRPERRSMAFVHDAPTDLIASTGLAVVTPQLGSPTFVYQCVTSDECVDHLVAAATGSAYPAVNPTILAKWRVAVPSDNGAEFDKLARPIEAWRHQLASEMATLTNIRNVLLPRLISGEIRVPDTNDSAEVIDLAAEQLVRAPK